MKDIRQSAFDLVMFEFLIEGHSVNLIFGVMSSCAINIVNNQSNTCEFGK